MGRRATGRRTALNAAMTDHYRLDDLLIDVPRQQVGREGTVLDVGGLSFRLLHYLLQQGQRVVRFDELIEHVWAPAVVNEETVTQRVRLLRQALGDDGRKPRYLRSVRSQGYQLCVPPQALQGGVAAARVVPPWRPSRAHVMLVAAAVLIVAGVAAWALLHRPVAPIVASSPLLQRADYYAGIGQRDNNERAIALYRQRLQEAPDDVRAQAGLSRAYSARACLYNGESVWSERAQALAERVLAAQPDNAAGHAALAYSYDCRGRIDRALAGYERAVQLDPAADSSRASAAYLYERKGRLADALAANLAVRDPAKVRFLPIQIASNLDLLGYVAAAEARYRRSFQLYPDNVFSNQVWPRFLFEHGRSREAQAALEEALARGTDHAGLHLLAVELALQRGDVAVARQASGRALALRPGTGLPQTVAWLVAEARPPAQRLREQGQSLRAAVGEGSDPFDGLDAALLLDAAGEPEAAVAALDEAVGAGYRDAAYLRVSPLFASLRTASGFAPLLARIDAAVARERQRVRALQLLPQETGASN